ncbi:RagB/SusD family nutrient uptake outer membrane protein [Dyadobacter pollutisoli]|uniref:RagB/SusD family nutrient uptake outer membrane protein n=1 Tax=Dyadobacter pollutisoli TaxID=2910158 RepID=A0A9E8SN69_9BACT|nr:RagB/SusD family nutrient uptake outer membrane protein [Dyadobacter pollutisoli]WAC14943.1 RagB/SusD family nutrient uptake outer membrane protein [Dyadobacter pollutisoli]
MKKIFSLIVLIPLQLVMQSCGESFLYKEPKGTVIPESLNTLDGVNYLLIGAYSLLDGWGSGTANQQNMSAAASIKNWVWNSASDDSYKGSTPGDLSPAGEIEQYVALPTNIMIEYKWQVHYDGISRCNDVLRAIKNAGSAIDESNRKILEGQARFLRGLYHFRMQVMHYQVPYISEEVEDPSKVPNDRLIWDDLEKDLQFALDNLPERFAGNPGRATKFAAITAKAYVHMFQKEYSEAKTLLDMVINSKKFALVDSFYHNYTSYTENNVESIFEIQYSVNDGTTQGRNGNSDSWLTLPYNRYLPTCCGFFQPSDDLVNAFKVDANGLPLLGINGPRYNDTPLPNDMGINPEETFVPPGHLFDPRLDWTVGRRGIPYLDWGIHSGRDFVRDQDNGGPYAGKKQMYYKREAATAAESTFARANAKNFRFYRYAHVLLWRAECAIEENDLVYAKELINQVRRRASNDIVYGKVKNTSFGPSIPIVVDYTEPAANYKLGEYTTFPSQAYAREALRMELRLETALEGNRFFDLVRWGIDQQVLSKFIANDSKYRSFMGGTSYAPRNAKWPLPQSQIDLQKGVLIQDPNY